MSKIEETLEKRNNLYGGFDKVASISQELKRVMKPALVMCDDVSREAIEMILHKLARVAASPNGWKVADNAHDIAGYAKLWEEHLSGVEDAVFTEVKYKRRCKDRKSIK